LLAAANKLGAAKPLDPSEAKPSENSTERSEAE
jgi:hypothetical protein